MTRGTGRGRTGKPVDDFQDDQTGDRGDDAATEAAKEAVAESTLGHNSGETAKTGLDLGSQAKKLQDSIESWEGQQAEIDAIMDEAKERCQPYKDEQKAIAKACAEGSADEAAIPKQVFKAAIIIRRNEAKKERTLRKLNDDQRDEVLALADSMPEDFIPLPLGQWALRQAEKKKSSRGARK
jgi:hypothetical protein